MTPDAAAKLIHECARELRELLNELEQHEHHPTIDLPLEGAPLATHQERAGQGVRALQDGGLR
jgi:hypothetical protein